MKEVLKAAIYSMLVVVTVSCESPQKDQIDGADVENKDSAKRFTLLSPEKTGINFKNTISESPKLNYFMFEYIYNGAGVAVGDINNDGLSDLYFTGNMVPDKLYLNKGDMVFEDITESAIGDQPEGWHNGVSMVDVNSDGLLDIYVCRSGPFQEKEKLRNRLYINNGDLSFTEKGLEYGVADEGRSTHSAFFDYDGDSDLDLYIINTPLQGADKLSTLEVQQMIDNKTSPTDRLYRNDGNGFTDVTDESGVRNFGYGLGVAVADLNNDGLPDIYVSNDYIAPDHLYVNQGNGTFKDEILTMTAHISNNGMGNDIADFNNDGFPDIIELDMASPDHVRSKKNMAGMSSEKFWNVVKVGYHHQYMVNTLQLNNGNGTFSEVAQHAGVASTDWSWAPLFADFDNDGDKDLFVTNGYKRDMRDNDYLQFLEETKQKTSNPDLHMLLSKAPSTKLQNYLFENVGQLSFKNVAVDWGVSQKLNSNGVAYGDLDNDGDLDLIVNNVEDYSGVYQNNSESMVANNSIRVKLEGEIGAVVGAKVYVETGEQEQFQAFYTSRGFQSSVEPILHFGIGESKNAKSVKVVWPDGKYSELADVPAGTVTVNISDARSLEKGSTTPKMFARESGNSGFNFVHKENEYNDFTYETLLPHRQSAFGPFMSQGDVNGDGLSDIYVGGAVGQSGELFIQSSSGKFRKSSGQPWSAHSDREDLGSEFFDADGDGDLDLYVASGSNEFPLQSPQLEDRLYLNNGSGKFTYSQGALPTGDSRSTQVVKSADVDGDGDLDLFVGGRTTPRVYPFPAKSQLLLNDNGRFADVTSAQAPELVQPGMITDAEFVDMDKDGDLDLVTVGEWMNVKVFENRSGTFKDQSELWGTSNAVGWWNSVNYGDFDNDGDVDIVAGNLGWNSKFHGTTEHPIQVYLSDFDDNGKSDIVLAKNQGNVVYPVRGRECSSEQMPFIKEKFPNYDGFAKASLFEIYDPNKLANSIQYSATQMRSAVFLNDSGRFKMIELPARAQISAIQDIIVKDIDNDGVQDLIIAGNMFGAEVETVRQDAGDGLVLIGNGDGTFDPIPGHESGLHASGDVKDLLLIESETGDVLFIAKNNSKVESYRLNKPSL